MLTLALAGLLAVLAPGAGQVEGPRVRVQLLVNSGEENPTLDLTSEKQWAEFRRRLKDLPLVAAPAPQPAGSGGYLAVNSGVAGIPEQLQVSGGIVAISNRGARKHFRDTRKLGAWLDSQFRKQQQK